MTTPTVVSTMQSGPYHCSSFIRYPSARWELQPDVRVHQTAATSLAVGRGWGSRTRPPQPNAPGSGLGVVAVAGPAQDVAFPADLSVG